MTAKKQIHAGELVDREQLPYAPAQSTPSGYGSLIAMAVEKNLDIEKLKQLMDLEDKWEAKQARKAFFHALSEFQSELPEINKRGRAGFDHKDGGGKTEYSFAKLEDIAKAIRPGLAKHGLSYRFEQTQLPAETFERQSISVTCVVTHSAGHSESMSMTGTPDTTGKKSPIQAVSSAVSYMRRYTLTGALGVVVGGEDDDAGAGDINSQAPEEDQTSYCSDEFFNKSLPRWKEAIVAKGKKVDALVAFLKSKGTHLSPEQIHTLKEAIK